MQVRQTVPYFAFIFSRYISWLPGLTHCIQDRKYLCQAKACLTEDKSERKKKTVCSKSKRNNCEAISELVQVNSLNERRFRRRL